MDNNSKKVLKVLKSCKYKIYWYKTNTLPACLSEDIFNSYEEAREAAQEIVDFLMATYIKFKIIKYYEKKHKKGF